MMNEIIIEKYWSDYQLAFASFQKCCAKNLGGEHEFTKRLRHFDLRFRNALDMKISFEGIYSKTKTKAVQKSYEGLVELCNLWNVWEALILLLPEEDHINGVSLCKKYVKTGIIDKDVFAASIALLKSNEQIVIPYICRLYETAQKQQRMRMDKIKTNLASIDCESVVALVYAERNNYYHNGECSKYEMSYAVRNKLLNAYTDLILHMVFKGSIHLLTKGKMIK